MVALGTALALVCPALGAEPEGQPADSSWRLHLSPYVWLTGVDGSINVGGAATAISIGFDEPPGLTNAGFRLLAAAEKGDWTIAADLTLADIELEESDEIAEIEVGLEQTILAVKAGYRILPRSAEPDPVRGLPRGLGLVLEIGLRYWDIAMDSRVAFDLLPPGQLPPELRLQGDDRWVDLLVGASYQAPLSRHLAISAEANIGGFAIGSSSRVSWETSVAATLVAARHWAFSAGYRALQRDRATSEGSADRRTEAMLHGPLLGATYSF